MSKEPIKNGLIGKWQPNGTVELGDALQREGMYWLGVGWTGIYKPIPGKVMFFESVNDLEHPTYRGFWRRSNDTDWSGDFDRMSRDQAIPLVICLSEYKMYKRLFMFLVAHVLRLGFFTNIRRNGSTKENHGKDTPNGKKFNYRLKLPDIAGLSFIALYIRGFNAAILWPFLNILDIELLINAILWRWFKKNDNDICNHMLISINAHKKLPSITSILANHINDATQIAKKIDAYFDKTESQSIKNIFLFLLIGRKA